MASYCWKLGILRKEYYGCYSLYINEFVSIYAWYRKHETLKRGVSLLATGGYIAFANLDDCDRGIPERMSRTCTNESLGATFINWIW